MKREIKKSVLFSTEEFEKIKKAAYDEHITTAEFIRKKAIENKDAEENRGEDRHETV